MTLTLNDIVKLGDPTLYEVCEPVVRSEINDYLQTARKMADLVTLFRNTYGRGRAIAAPQVGVLKRIIVLNIDQPVVMFNPEIYNMSEEKISLWDDCMSFPNLMVKVERHRFCTLSFRDANWQKITWELADDLSELLQHEYDHLEGILAIDRATDNRALKWVSHESRNQQLFIQ